MPEEFPALCTLSGSIIDTPDTVFHSPYALNIKQAASLVMQDDLPQGRS
jgi:hypothetical protein